MGICRRVAANVLESVGIGFGNKPLIGTDYVELQGFRPYPAIRIPNNLDHEWEVGFEWYLKRIEGKVVLDTGYMAHKGFTKVLGESGLVIIGIDLLAGEIPNVNCIQSPVWDMDIPNNSINTIIANSLLEHIGLDCYKQPVKNDAREATLSEFKRKLKLGGVLLMQVPYSNIPVMIKHNGEQFYIPWNQYDIAGITRYFTIEEKTYYARAKKRWLEVSESIACQITQGGGFPSCIVYIKARNNE